MIQGFPTGEKHGKLSLNRENHGHGPWLNQYEGCPKPLALRSDPARDEMTAQD
jgi:hypothetical protein